MKPYNDKHAACIKLLEAEMNGNQQQVAAARANWAKFREVQLKELVDDEALVTMDVYEQEARESWNESHAAYELQER